MKLRLDRAAFARADMVVFNSQAGHDSLIGVLKVPPARTAVINNGIRPFTEQVDDRRGIVCLARFLPPKRHDLLLDALSLMNAQERPTLHMYGMGTDSAELHAEISRRQLAPHVQAFGETADPMQAVATAELAVLPSDHEGMPNVVLEAWAAGTPVLASNVSGVNQLVRHGVDGWLVENTPGDWADAISLLSGDHKLRERLVAGGRERLKVEFSMADCAANWAGLYGSLCAWR
ncbi:MAG TPA: glycosyltransferase [Firmicutes bacterium]|nr:glycosyltransferase [Bacillota bacterium]